MQITNSSYLPSLSQTKISTAVTGDQAAEFEPNTTEPKSELSYTKASIDPAVYHKLIDLDLSQIKKISSEAVSALNSILEAANFSPPATEAPKEYATIVKNGDILATFYTDGGMMTPNGTPLPKDPARDGTGISLDEKRIAQMLKLTGETVQYK